MALTEISEDDSYGYNWKNPIMVGGEENAVGAYLNALLVSNKKRLHIKDIKYNYKRKTGLLQIVLWYEDSTGTTTLYISERQYKDPKCPQGFFFKTLEDVPKEILFPEEKIKKTAACDEKIFMVDDYLLETTLNQSYPNPQKNASYKGGIDSLSAYFSINPLTDPEVKKMMFRVHISFLVNCEGDAGNFQIISKGSGQMKTYANQVLEIVNGMPQNWIPAEHEGIPVDSYQVLSFTVFTGSLEKVNYRE